MRAAGGDAGAGGALAGAVRRLHGRLLPPSKRLGWMPYLWLFWLLTFFQKWFFLPLEPVELGLSLGTVALFLPVYFNGYWRSGQRLLVNVALILLLGVVWLPLNPGAVTFFVYAAAFVGRAVRPPRAYAYLAGLALLILVEALLLERPAVFLLFGAPVAALVGAASVQLRETERQESALRLSQAEVRRLAAVTGPAVR